MRDPFDGKRSFSNQDSTTRGLKKQKQQNWTLCTTKHLPLCHRHRSGLDPPLHIYSEIPGGLFHFKKDNAQYSLKPEDYVTKPLFVASKENQFLNMFFLYVLEDLHTCQSLGAPARAHQTKRMVLSSSRQSGATAVRRRHQPCPWRRCHPAAGRG